MESKSCSVLKICLCVGPDEMLVAGWLAQFMASSVRFGSFEFFHELSGHVYNLYYIMCVYIYIPKRMDAVHREVQ